MAFLTSFALFLGAALTLSQVSRASYVRARAFFGRGRSRYGVRMDVTP